MVQSKVRISSPIFLDFLPRYVGCVSVAVDIHSHHQPSSNVNPHLFTFSLSHTLPPHTLSPSSLSLPLLWGGGAASQSDQNGSYLGLGHHQKSVGGMFTCGWAWIQGMQTHYRPCGMRWDDMQSVLFTDHDQYDKCSNVSLTGVYLHQWCHINEQDTITNNSCDQHGSQWFMHKQASHSASSLPLPYLKL